MGANLSCLSEGDGGPPQPCLGDIPESCIASVFMYMTPQEICRLARLSRSFRGASSADFVWELKLPSNYRYLWNKVFEESVDNCTKKEIYALLSRPNPFDDGTKEVWLEKTTGGICLSISSKAMSITGIDDRRYWNHIPTDESRFGSVAYLQQIWWFEVHGELEFDFPAGRYSLYFRLQLGRASKRFGRRQCNYNQVHGWNLKPVKFEFSVSGSQPARLDRYLEDPQLSDITQGICLVRGNWTEYHVGDFVVANSGHPQKIKYSMMQIDCTHTKGGLCLESVLIIPSGSSS